MVSINKYTVVTTLRAQKDIETLPSFIKEKIKNVSEELSVNPYLGKPLKWVLKGLYTLRLGNYRIIYMVGHKIITITIIKVRHRKAVYRDS